MKQSSFDATISALDAETSALDVETSAFGAATSAIARRSFDVMISSLDSETSALGAATSVIARSYRRYRRGVSGDFGIGITPQMCNRVTNHGDMSTFSKPESPRGPDTRHLHIFFPVLSVLCRVSYPMVNPVIHTRSQNVLIFFQ